MYIQQADLFHGVNREFVKEVMEIAEKVTGEDGEILFSQGDPATLFYILLKGRVRLTVHETGQVYTVSRSGEAFGWSSLVGRNAYSASAVCAGSTKLLRIARDSFETIANRDPVSGMVFYKHLAQTLGVRLIQSYASMTGRSLTAPAASPGTRQVTESPILT